jgi:excisionase family DNA binding protein
MNLADAIRSASNGRGFDDPAPQIESPALELEVEEPEVAPAPISRGATVKLELYLNAEQVAALLQGVVGSSHAVMTLREAATFLRIPSSKLESMAENREVPGFQIDGKWRFSRVTLEDWVVMNGLAREVGA